MGLEGNSQTNGFVMFVGPECAGCCPLAVYVVSCVYISSIKIVVCLKLLYLKNRPRSHLY